MCSIVRLSWLGNLEIEKFDSSNDRELSWNRDREARMDKHLEDKEETMSMTHESTHRTAALHEYFARIEFPDRSAYCKFKSLTKC